MVPAETLFVEEIVPPPYDAEMYAVFDAFLVPGNVFQAVDGVAPELLSFPPWKSM
jgi:hypothetical protein